MATRLKGRADEEAAADARAERLLPGRDHTIEPAPFDRQRIAGIAPEIRIEDARRAREQLTRIQSVPFLGDPLAQLIGAQQEQPRLLDFALKLAGVGRELLALVGDVLAFRRRVFRGRGSELLQPLRGFVGARLDLVELVAEFCRQLADLLAQLGELFGRYGLVLDRGFGLVERGLDVVERWRRRGRGGLGLLLRKP